MTKPRIVIYKIDERYSYVCDFADRIYRKRLNEIKAIFYVLNIYYLCEKDENGYYLKRDNIKPIFY